MAQIGFIGLGKMGGNMVARIKRDSDHEVVAFDFDIAAVHVDAVGRNRGRCGQYQPQHARDDRLHDRLPFAANRYWAACRCSRRCDSMARIAAAVSSIERRVTSMVAHFLRA